MTVKPLNSKSVEPLLRVIDLTSQAAFETDQPEIVVAIVVTSSWYYQASVRVAEAGVMVVDLGPHLPSIVKENSAVLEPTAPV